MSRYNLLHLRVPRDQAPRPLQLPLHPLPWQQTQLALNRYLQIFFIFKSIIYYLYIYYLNLAPARAGDHAPARPAARLQVAWVGVPIGPSVHLVSPEPSHNTYNSDNWRCNRSFSRPLSAANVVTFPAMKRIYHHTLCRHWAGVLELLLCNTESITTLRCQWSWSCHSLPAQGLLRTSVCFCSQALSLSLGSQLLSNII